MNLERQYTLNLFLRYRVPPITMNKNQTLLAVLGEHNIHHIFSMENGMLILKHEANACEYIFDMVDFSYILIIIYSQMVRFQPNS